MTRFLLDTDILINWLRGEKWEKALLLTPGIDFYYSRMSAKELFQYGPLSQEQKKRVVYFLRCLREIPVTPAIAEKTSQLLTKYAKKNPLHVADALIAATAWEKHLPLLTHNKKHFAFISEIRVNDLPAGK